MKISLIRKTAEKKILKVALRKTKTEDEHFRNNLGHVAVIKSCASIIEPLKAF